MHLLGVHKARREEGRHITRIHLHIGEGASKQERKVRAARMKERNVQAARMKERDVRAARMKERDVRAAHVKSFRDQTAKGAAAHTSTNEMTRLE